MGVKLRDRVDAEWNVKMSIFYPLTKIRACHLTMDVKYGGKREYDTLQRPSPSIPDENLFGAARCPFGTGAW